MNLKICTCRHFRCGEEHFTDELGQVRKGRLVLAKELYDHQAYDRIKGYRHHEQPVQVIASHFDGLTLTDPDTSYGGAEHSEALAIIDSINDELENRRMKFTKEFNVDLLPFLQFRYVSDTDLS